MVVGGAQSGDDTASRPPASASETLGDEELAELDQPRPRTAVGRGAAIDRYVILERIGAGGMGVVYAAWDPELDRRVAVKLLHAAELGSLKGSRGQTRLLREAQALARLTHPNVVTVHDAGTFRGRVFVAMEFVEGLTLTRWLAERARPWSEVVQMVCRAGDGLVAAHAEGLVHRDFKPDNVIVGNDDRPRVLDFGLARAARDRQLDAEPLDSADATPLQAVDSEESLESLESLERRLDARLTATGALMGTPAYMAPEQHNRLPADARSDQFSFCVTLWEALYGERPFDGPTRVLLAVNVCRGKIREPPAHRKVPKTIRRALQRGLAPAPEDRWPSLAELLAELRARPTSARRITALGLGGALTISAAAWMAYAPVEVVDACAAGDRRVAGVWGPSAQQRVHDAVLGTEVAFGPATWASVERDLDRYARDWAAGYRDACEATHTRHEQSGDMLDRRMECLQDRLETMRATVQVLGTADRDVVGTAAEVVAKLPRIDRCADTEALRARLPPPADPKVRARLDELRSQTADLRAQSLAGRYAEAYAAVQSVRAQAQELGVESFLAELYRVEGRLAVVTGDVHTGVERLEQAALLALTIGHDEVLAGATDDLANAVGVSLSRYDEGELWGRQAGAAARRLGEDSPEVASHNQSMCMLLADRGAPDRAMPYCESAVRRYEALVGPNHLSTGEAYRGLGNAMLQAGRYDEAGSYYRRSHEILATTKGPEHPDNAIVLNSLAAVCYSKAGAADCVDEFREALDAARRGFGEGHPAVADFTNNLAIMLVATGELEEAKALAAHSLEIRTAASGQSHPGVGAAHRTLGGIALQEGDTAAALEHFDAAVDNLETTRGIDHPDVVEARLGRGQARLQAGREREGLEDLQQALAIVERTESIASRRAEVQATLALALLEYRPRQRARALELVAKARPDLDAEEPVRRRLDETLAESTP